MASNFKNLPDIATIQPERLIKYRISEDKFSAEVLLPGLWYTDFDKKIGGKVNLWSILKLYESVRWSSLMHGALYYPELCHGTNHTLFIAGERSVLAKKMSEMVFDSHFGFRVPMRGVLYASQIGKSSFSLTATLYDYKTGDEILTSVTKLVYVNNATRKPSPLPEYFLKGAKEHLANVPFGTIDRKSPSPVLGTAFRHTSKVLHSDCDLNLHANQSVYLRWCSDAGTKAALNGHLRQFRRHIELYPLKSMNNHYIGEALVNSEIVVHVWEDPERLRCLNFVITSNTKVIFTLDLEYFDGDPVKVAPHLEAKLCKLTLWSVSKIFESIRYSVLGKGFGYFDRFKDDQHSIFMASTEYKFTRAALSLTAKSHWGRSFPIYAALNVIYAGSSSFTFDTTLYDHATGEQLMSANLTFVYIDFNSRKPARFPEWYNEAKRLRNFGPPIERLPTFEIPKDAFAFNTRSSYSDMDFNGHVNSSIYVKWCSDAGSEAAIQGYLKDFRTEIGKYPESRLRLKYIGEGMVDEDFVTYTWQDVIMPLTLNFVIMKNGKKVFVASFSYYSNTVPSKL